MNESWRKDHLIIQRRTIVASEVGSLAVDASPGGFLLLGTILTRVANGTDGRGRIVGVRGWVGASPLGGGGWGSVCR